jgi:hypothetical protein
MPCVLRACGKNFDVDSFLAVTKLHPIAVWRRGQKFKRKVGGRMSCRNSGFSCDVSNRGFNQLQAQIKDAKEFIKFLRRDLKKLKTFPGVEEMELDFGITNRPLSNKNIIVQGEVFPAELAQLAGSVGLNIAITLYPLSFPFLKRKSKK